MHKIPCQKKGKQTTRHSTLAEGDKPLAAAIVQYGLSVAQPGRGACWLAGTPPRQRQRGLIGAAARFYAIVSWLSLGAARNLALPRRALCVSMLR